MNSKTQTPWGISDYVKPCIRGVALVQTPSHGGIRVSATLAKNQLSDACLFFGEQIGNYFFFEEDCAYALPFFEHPEWFKEIYRPNETEEVLKNNAEKTIKTYFPEYFERVNNGFKMPSYEKGKIVEVKKDIKLVGGKIIEAGSNVIVVNEKKRHFMEIKESYLFRLSAEQIKYYLED
jgi:hypothetical protein